MSDKLTNLKKILEKSSKVKGDILVASELVKLEERIDEVEEKLAGKEQITTKVVEELKGKDGIDGEDYVLTEKDKKEIASLIEIPVVEKVIEKIETIIEQPIINSETIEVENDETGEEIVEKINELSVEDDKYKIDASHIKNLPIGKGGGGSTARNLYQLMDVQIDSLASGDLIQYDGTAWRNVAYDNNWDKPFGSATFTYDVDGNIDTKVVGVTTLTYSYNVDGNVDSITDGTHTKAFVYNVDGDVEAIIYS